MTKGELLAYLEPFDDKLLLRIRLPNGNLAGIKELEYEFAPRDYEAVVILSVIQPSRPKRV